MALRKELQDNLAKIFADACAERVQGLNAGGAKLSPRAAVLCLRTEYEQLLNQIDLLTGEEFQQVATSILTYDGTHPGDLYEQIKLNAYTGGFSIPPEEQPTTEEYLRSLSKLLN